MMIMSSSQVRELAAEMQKANHSDSGKKDALIQSLHIEMQAVASKLGNIEVKEKGKLQKARFEKQIGRMQEELDAQAQLLEVPDLYPIITCP